MVPTLSTFRSLSPLSIWKSYTYEKNITPLLNHVDDNFVQDARLPPPPQKKRIYGDAYHENFIISARHRIRGVTSYLFGSAGAARSAVGPSPYGLTQCNIVIVNNSIVVQQFCYHFSLLATVSASQVEKQFPEHRGRFTLEVSVAKGHFHYSRCHYMCTITPKRWCCVALPK